MPIRVLGPCRDCCHWRDHASIMLTGSHERHGECRRRVQPGEDGLRPRQPMTQPGDGCSEHMPFPAPEHLADNCGDCRYWKAPPVEPIGPEDEGLCCVWAPRWSGSGRHHAFPVTRRDFQCGDGVSHSYIDPEDAGMFADVPGGA